MPGIRCQVLASLFHICFIIIEVCKRIQSPSLYPPQQYDDALADDVERAEKKSRTIALNLKRKSVVALGELTHRRIRPTLLGPALTVRLTQIAETPLRVFNSECAGQ